MNYILGIITSILLVSFQSVAQITGRAIVEGQSVHDGIKVTFIAKSPSAHTDSTYTKVDGSFSIDLKAGIYQIIFDKDGILGYYKDNSPVLLQGPQVLDETIVSSKIYVSGLVGGRWTGKNRYIVQGDLTVMSKDTLVIEPGAIIDFQGPFSISVQDNAFIKASGMQNKKITFTASDGIAWGGIILGNVNAKFEYCLFENFQEGLSIGSIFSEDSASFFDVFSCEFRNFTGTAIYSYVPTTRLENNIFHDFNNAIAIDASYVGNPISCNYIYNSWNSTGIDAKYCHSAVDNYIENMDEGTGIQYSYCSITNNVINKAKVGICQCEAVYETNGKIMNCLIANCSESAVKYGLAGIIFHERLINSVFVGNKCVVKVPQDSKVTIKPNPVVNNLLYHNETNFEFFDVFALGNLITVNNNGDSIDAYNNLYEDPLLVNNTSFLLSDHSPVRGAGANGVDIGPQILNTCMEKYFYPFDIRADTLSISGIVHLGNTLLGNVAVVATNIHTKYTYGADISPNGNFVIKNLPRGQYQVKAIPSTTTPNPYVVTYYPNKTNESAATPLDLQHKIVDLDIYLAIWVGIKDMILSQTPAHPNPFGGSLTIGIAETVVILDAKGGIMYQGRPRELLDTSLWPQGLYLLKTKNGMHKLIKDK